MNTVSSFSSTKSQNSTIDHTSSGNLMFHTPFTSAFYFCEKKILLPLYAIHKLKRIVFWKQSKLTLARRCIQRVKRGHLQYKRIFVEAAKIPEPAERVEICMCKKKINTGFAVGSIRDCRTCGTGFFRAITRII